VYNRHLEVDVERFLYAIPDLIALGQNARVEQARF
jgi:hypothetical protein